ncbi:hypothetical protein BG006_002279 [Podila minutissima]|uniref:Cas12f1-like TNB domain-containing protein n=1 Tax=Podila minutissima TaxID=64525 RepID=A0A9P5SPC1_9FUNG|nr:hypothetical protein BG006_002279 [Podila minutissima]
MLFKKHKWDATWAKEEEFRLIANHILKLAQSLDYVVVGVNEYYTSKKCPVCFEFVYQVNIRRLYCKTCESFIHHDVMAGHNICNIIQGYLMEQKRPDYLQPVDKDGRRPWQEDLNSTEGAGSNSSTSTTTHANPRSSPAQGSKKRKPVGDNKLRPSPSRQSKKCKAREEDEQMEALVSELL